MEYGLPDALRHIFSNVEYYSSALFHYSMQLLQNFIYQVGIGFKPCLVIARSLGYSEQVRWLLVVGAGTADDAAEPPRAVHAVDGHAEEGGELVVVGALLLRSEQVLEAPG